MSRRTNRKAKAVQIGWARGWKITLRAQPKIRARQVLMEAYPAFLISFAHSRGSDFIDPLADLAPCFIKGSFLRHVHPVFDFGETLLNQIEMESPMAIHLDP